MNTMMVACPFEEDIQQAVFNINKESSPGPDGFGGTFFQTYWSIVQFDVCRVDLQFFNHGQIIPNLNASSIILLPKTKDVDSLDKYRLIVVFDFKFKIISKILADRLASLMPLLVFKEKKGFIRGRNIRDCIFLASEALNLLDRKSFDGNVAIKVNINKAFDTLE